VFDTSMMSLIFVSVFFNAASLGSRFAVTLHLVSGKRDVQN